MVPGESAIGLEPLAYNPKSTDTSVLRSQAISTKRIADALERIAAAMEFTVAENRARANEEGR